MNSSFYSYVYGYRSLIKHISHKICVLSILLFPMIFASSPQAATLSVTSTFDNMSSGSLRRAVADATDGDTIDLSGLALPATITLTSGEIAINKNLTITGPGPRNLTISGGGSSRIFNIDSAAAAINVAINGVSISNGNFATTGGCLSVSGNVTATLTDAAVMNCHVTDTGSSMGGAIYNDASLNLNRVLLTNNSAVILGGAIYNQTNGTLILNNSTISGNSANSAGAIYAYGILSANNTTVSGNTSAGVAVEADFAIVSLYNCILAGNAGGDFTGVPVTAHNNLVQIQLPVVDLGAGGIGNVTEVSPLLGPLGNNGGPTDTHALLPGSPALNSGEAATCLLNDQRGVNRPQGAGCDMGAYEAITGQLGGAIQNGSINLTSTNAGVATLAGLAGTFGSSDGIGTAARFYWPFHTTCDGSNIYIADRENHTIRKMVIANGTVTTLAGTAGNIGSTNAIGPAASFNFPDGITTDGVYLYVADSGNNKIRRITIASGDVITLAGTGSAGALNGPALSATFNSPSGLTTDGLSLFVAEAFNHTIRRIDLNTGWVSTLAGTPTVSGSQDGIGPNGLFNAPQGITTDGVNLFVADYNNSTVRRIEIATATVSTLAGLAGSFDTLDGPGSSARFQQPVALVTDGASLYLSDTFAHTIRRIDYTVTPDVTSIAGAAGTPGSSDGSAGSARFNAPYGITSDGTRLFVIDKNNFTVRLIGQSSLLVSPPALAFGSVGIGFSAVQPLTITNSGNMPLLVTSYFMSATPDFGPIVPGKTNPCPTPPYTLASGASCTIDVTFHPTIPSPPVASIDIFTSAPGSPVNVPLSGVGGFPCTWTAGVTGNWSDSTKWTGNCTGPIIPGPADFVVIPASGTSYTVNLDGNSTITAFKLGTQATLGIAANNLILNGPGSMVEAGGTLDLSGGILTIPVGLAVNGAFNWTGGTISGAGLFGISGGATATISGSSVKTLDTATFMSAAYIPLTGTGNLNFVNGAVFQNDGIFDLQADTGITGTGTFNNNSGAVIKKSAGTGTSAIGPAFNNTGAINLQSGLISLGGAGSVSLGATDVTIRGITPGTDYGQLYGYNTNLTGPLNVNFSAYTPIVGDSYTVLTCMTCNGTFSGITSTPSLPANMAWSQTNTVLSVTLKVIGTQTITFNNPGPQTFGMSPTLTATASSGLTPTFTSTTTAVCAINAGGTLTFNGFGTCTIAVDQAGDSNYTPATQVSQSFTINPVPAITTATLPNGTTGIAYSQTITASAGTAPITFAISTGTIPTGLTLTTAGILSGTPAAAGMFTFDVIATDSVGATVFQTYTVNVIDPMVFTTTSLPAGTINFPYSQTITATGGMSPLTYSTAGPLPAGVILSSSGLLSGTPTVTGTFSFTVTATDSLLNTVNQLLSVIINPMVTIITSTLPGGTVGVPYSQTIATSGGTAPISVTMMTGIIPTGLILTAGVLSGTPTANGSFTFTVEAVDAAGAIASQTYSFIVKAVSSVTTWPTASSITSGQTLADSILSGGASTPAGTFAFTIPSTMPVAGTAPQNVTFTPTDTANYTSVSGTVNVTVNQIIPTITWTSPAAITYGTALSATQLNATASVPGTFAYTPVSGSVLNTGTQTLSVTFTPTDTLNYTTQTGTVSLTVNQVTPTVTWSAPAAITYGTALSATQFNATASVPGTFAYTPASGSVLNTGTQTLSVTFTPTDTLNYTAQTGTVSLTVNQVTPTVTWPAPAAITYGTALSATQLNATASVPGTFNYTPTTGTVLTAGAQTLSVAFTPTDTLNYNAQTGTVSLTVNQATPAVTWAAPAAITYGTALSATQLNATASVPGTFAYTPTTGTVLTAGTQPLSVTFTPTDTVNYTAQTGSVNLTVNPTPTIITTVVPSVIVGSAYSQSINATGGTAPVTFIASGTLPPGISLSPTGLLSGTALAPGSYPFTVTMEDANLQSSSMPLTIVVAPPPDSATITGNITYSGAKTGRIYISVRTNRGTLGTSIAAPGAYSIRGVPNGSYTVRAFMDSLNLGTQVQVSPDGSTTTTLAGATVSGVNITLTDPSPIAPPMPAAVSTSAGNGSVLIDWDKPRNNGIEAADAYDIYWSPLNTVSKTSFIGSRLNVPAGQDSPAVIDGLTNGNTLYFVVVPKSGSIEGASSAVFGPITVGPPAGGYTVSGTVNYSGPTPTGPLHVAIVTPSTKGAAGVYYTTITNPAATNSFSVAGVQNGSYVIYSIIDMNNDKLFGIGDVMTHDNQAPMITVNGAAVSGIVASLIATNGELFINTDHVMMATGPGKWFNINGGIRGQLKRPVAVTLTGAPAAANLTVPMDLGIDNENSAEFRFWTNNNGRPTVSDVYAFTVTYADGTVDSTATATVTGVIDSFPTNVQILTPVSTVPTFSWGAPPTPPATYKYGIWVSDNNGANFWDAWDLPSSMNSAIYGSSGDNAQPLQLGNTYNWDISVSDENGNRASIVSSFVPTAAGTPGITWQTPAPILSGTLLSAVQLNATASVPGTFSYSPAAGTILSAGVQTLNVTFTPADTANFTTAIASTILTVNPATLIVTATAGAGGSITPSGTISVPSGSAQNFTITPNTGYSIADVKIDGVSQGAISSYSFTNVIDAHTIDATFVIKTYPLATSVSAGLGTISVSPLSASYNHGSVVLLTAIPDTQWVFTSWGGDCTGSANPYSLVMNAAKICSASFSAATFKITATAGGGGSITPAGVTTVAYNGSHSYVISANSGYHILDVKIDGVSHGAISSYAFTNIIADHTIDVRFAVNLYIITASAGAGGSISPSGSTALPFGAEQTYVFTPGSGYFVDIVKIDNISIGMVSSYTFTNLKADHTITVEFAKPNGVLDLTNTSGVPKIGDAMIALAIAVGDITPTPSQLAHADVAPLINGVPQPDGKIDIGDVLWILRKVVGLVF